MSQPSNPLSEANPRRFGRGVTVGMTVVTATAVFTIATGPLGIDVRSPAMGEQPSMDIPLVLVVGVSGVAALAGWALLAVLERLIRRPRQVWQAAALVVLVASLGAPLTGTGVAAANRVVLALLHVVVGTIVIFGMRRHAAPRTRATEVAEVQEIAR